MPNQAKPKAGSTYSRRYALKMILGLEPDMDMNLEDVIDRNESSHPAGKVFTAKKEIARSPARGANAKQIKASPAAHEMVTGKVTQALLPKSQLDDLETDLNKLNTAGKNRVISAFRLEYNISSTKIKEFITTPEHFSFIKSKIAEVESDSV